MDQITENAIAYARTFFADDATGHDFAHTMRVYRMACRIAEQEGCDARIAGLAALLHDVDDCKLSPETAQHKDNARAFLIAQGQPPETIQRILRMIDEVSFRGSDSVVPSTPEGMAVQDADRLDALGAIGIARAFAYGGAHGRAMHDPSVTPRCSMTEAEYRAGKSTTVNHFYEKLFLLEGMMNTAEGKRLAQEKTAYMRSFLGTFLEEWGE